MFRPILLILLLLVVSGCTAHHSLYEGPARPQNELAVLFHKTPGLLTKVCSEPELYGVDDRKGSTRSRFSKKYIFNPYVGASFRIKLLPGPHILSVGFLKAKGPLMYFPVKDQILKFEAKAGHVYELNIEVPEDFRWNVCVKDIAEKENFCTPTPRNPPAVRWKKFASDYYYYPSHFHHHHHH